MALLSILFSTFDDQNPGIVTAVCTLAPILFCFGFQMAIICVIAKSRRVMKIFFAEPMKQVVISTKSMVKLVGSIMLVELILISVWAGYASLVWIRIVVSEDRYGFPTSLFGECVTPTLLSAGFTLFFYLLHFVILVCCAIVLFKIRRVPLEYQESSYMSYAVLCLVQIFVLAIPILVAVSINADGRFVIYTLYVFFSVLAILVFMMVPKIWMVHTGLVLWKAEPLSMLGRMKGEYGMNPRGSGEANTSAQARRLSELVGQGPAERDRRYLVIANTRVCRNTRLTRYAKEEIIEKLIRNYKNG